MASAICYAPVMPSLSAAGRQSTRFDPSNNLFSTRTTNFGFLPLKRNVKFSVRSMKEDGEKETGQLNEEDLTPNRSKVTSKKTTDLFAFDGLAPERINGRAAMIGFVAAVGVELATGRGLLSQLMNGGVEWFLLTSWLLAFATVIPIYRGLSPESKNNGVFTSDAEIWNGRFAMIGLVALAFTELMKGGPLINA